MTLWPPLAHTLRVYLRSNYVVCMKSYNNTPAIEKHWKYMFPLLFLLLSAFTGRFIIYIYP